MTLLRNSVAAIIILKLCIVHVSICHQEPPNHGHDREKRTLAFDHRTRPTERLESRFALWEFPDISEQEEEEDGDVSLPSSLLDEILFLRENITGALVARIEQKQAWQNASNTTEAYIQGIFDCEMKLNQSLDRSTHLLQTGSVFERQFIRNDGADSLAEGLDEIHQIIMGQSIFEKPLIRLYMSAMDWSEKDFRRKLNSYNSYIKSTQIAGYFCLFTAYRFMELEDILQETLVASSARLEQQKLLFLDQNEDFWSEILDQIPKCTKEKEEKIELF